MLLYLLANQPPPDFLHDPFGQFVINVSVAIVVGIVTAFVAVWVFRKQRSKKEISYQIISDAPIASVNKEFQSRVMIVFDGKAVGGVRQVVLTLRNSGNIAVKRDDYDEPMRLTFKGSLILGSDILNTEPPSLINSLDKNALVTHDPVHSFDQETEARIEKLLLNPKQSITLTFLLDRSYAKLDVRGRIVGGEIVEERNKQSSVASLSYIAMGVGLIILLMGSLISYFPPLFQFIFLLIYILIFFFSFPYIISFILKRFK